MPRLNDKQFLDRVDEVLAAGESLSNHARKLGYKSENGVYQRLYRLGFKVASYRRRVPTHNNDTQAA